MRLFLLNFLSLIAKSAGTECLDIRRMGEKVQQEKNNNYKNIGE